MATQKFLVYVTACGGHSITVRYNPSARKLRRLIESLPESGPGFVWPKELLDIRLEDPRNLGYLGFAIITTRSGRLGEDDVLKAFARYVEEGQDDVIRFVWTLPNQTNTWSNKIILLAAQMAGRNNLTAEEYYITNSPGALALSERRHPKPLIKGETYYLCRI
ncbi:MAG: hypothetical protein M1352_01925 [Patescibacteria group bacterium]|nr:hypothetical protein [Patescibacteria group bacterium]